MSVSWMLGAGTIGHVSASLAGTSITPATFTATATEGGVAALIAVSGGNEAIVAGADGAPPSVRAVNSVGIAVPNVRVAFAVTEGGGSINTTSVTTDSTGVAALTKWTMGPVGALNSVTATAGVSSLVFKDAGCDNGVATGFAIALCYRTAMSASQRQAFVS